MIEIDNQIEYPGATFESLLWGASFVVYGGEESVYFKLPEPTELRGGMRVNCVQILVPQGGHSSGSVVFRSMHDGMKVVPCDLKITLTGGLKSVAEALQSLHIK